MKEEKKQETMPAISVIIASFNEEKNIRETIQRVYNTMPNCELILVEGGTDKTIEIAEEEKKKHASMIIIYNKENKADIVFASRFVAGSTIEDGSLTRMRRLANYVVSGFTSLLCGTRLTDVNAGFKAWKSNVIRDIDIQCNHFGYEPEIAIMAAKKGYTIIETPVNYKGRQRGIYNVKLLRDGIIIPLFLQIGREH